MLPAITQLAFARSPTSVDAMLLVAQVGLEIDDAQAGSADHLPPSDIGTRVVEQLQGSTRPAPARATPKLDRTV